MELTYCGVRHLTLCCLQTNVLPHWLASSILQCVPLYHKKSGNEGINSDIETVYWFLISLPFSSIEMVLQNTIHLFCWRIVQCLISDRFVWFYVKKGHLKCSLYRPGVAQSVWKYIHLLFLERVTRRGWVISSTLRPQFTPRKDLVHILQKAGWAPGPVWTGGKSRLHRDFYLNLY